MKRVILLFCLASLIFVIPLINSNDTITLEANFVGYAERLSIDVPEEFSSIDFGEVSKSNPWAQTDKMHINNTGNRDATVEIELDSSAPDVFNYLYLKPYGGQWVSFDEFTINISKYSSKTIYLALNLTDFQGNLSSNNLSLSTHITFIGMAA